MWKSTTELSKSPVLSRVSLNQRWIRIVPVALIMYTISFIDRTNISMALPSMMVDLHMSFAQAGNAAGIFFWGYLLLQIPGGHLAGSWSPKRLIAIFLIAWGLCATGCALVQTSRELWLMRLLLGIAEGGVWPVTLVLLSHWFPRKERARANAFWMVCLPLAVVVSSPLSGWILDRWSWRALFAVEGAFPFLWLIVWQAVIYDYPRDAKWMHTEEKEYLQSTIAHEASDDHTFVAEPVLRVLVRPQVLILTLICFLRNIADFGFLVWLPSAVLNAKNLSNTAVGSLISIPFIIGIVAMLINSWHSDKSGERRAHMALTFAIGGISLLAGAFISRRLPNVAFLCICLTAIGTNGALGPFWAIPTETLPRKVVGPAIGFINCVGNLGGFFGSMAIGYVSGTTNGFLHGFMLVGVSLLIASMLCGILTPGGSLMNVDQVKARS